MVWWVPPEHRFLASCHAVGAGKSRPQEGTKEVTEVMGSTIAHPVAVTFKYR